MAAPRLTDAVLLDTVRAIQAHGSLVGASKALGIPRGTIQSRVRDAERRGLCAVVSGVGEPLRLTVPTAPPVDAQPVATRPPIDPSYEHEWQTFASEIGMRESRYRGPCARPVKESGRIKILIIPDLHAPFHDKAMVAEMLTREADADVAVVMGDIGDGFNFSTFLKYEEVPYTVELAAVTHLIEQFSERFPRVVLITGNHDSPRFEKRLRDRLTPEMVQAIQIMAGGTLDPIEALCRQRFPNVELASHTTGRHTVKWMTQIGDAIFAHAEKYSITPGAAVRKIEEWLADNHDMLGLKPWRALFQAHTHMLSWVPWHNNKILVEVGCLCQTQGYALAAKIMGRSPRHGYVTLEQVNGLTDINSIRKVWLDVEATSDVA